MFSKSLIFVFISPLIDIIGCNILAAKSNFLKPRRERNNIVNKRVWMRNFDKYFKRGNIGHFVFRDSNLEDENLLQNNFNLFDQKYSPDVQYMSDYVDRQKRSSNSVPSKRTEKPIDKKSDSIENNNSDFARSKFMNEIKPTSIVNDYPYEVAIFLNNNKSYLNLPKNKINISKADLNKGNKNSSKDNNDTKIVTSKRSMKFDYQSDIIKKNHYSEDLSKNKTDDNIVHLEADNPSDRKTEKSVFEKENTEWRPNPPMPDVNVYKVVPNEGIIKSKPVTERGLIKVIAMLTKSFKKIMKQHSEIKDIHNKINEIYEEFTKTGNAITTKFKDFDLKYLYLIKLQDKMKAFEIKMADKEDYFKKKEAEIDKALKEFETQQNKFLQQQKQFYNIQKLMLAQNEKINLKQNLIAKTQGEISHRQNNFARILKKAKQLYMDNRNSAMTTKLSSSIAKTKEQQKPFFEPKGKPEDLITSTRTPESTAGSIKINLFSIPISNKVHEDPDEFILKEKDDQAIDDLVYKYYFNNTFIDSVMKNQILSSFLGSGTAKNKRQEPKTTLLLPVLEANASHTRKRRWTNHKSRHRNKKRNHRKVSPAIVFVTDEVNSTKHAISVNQSGKILIKSNDTPNKTTTMKDDPYLTMARTFCNQIGQNSNQQTLYWCIEKALRRLQFLGKPMPPPIKSTTLKTTTSTQSQSVHDKKRKKEKKRKEIQIKKKPQTKKTTAKLVTTTTSTTVKSTTPQIKTSNTTYANPLTEMKLSQDMRFFPDNDALETRLFEYDMKPDTDGNVYYSGSVHASAIIADTESEGVDDIMPGLESNSRVEVDPLAFDLQAKRRAIVRKLNERIKMSLG